MRRFNRVWLFRLCFYVALVGGCVLAFGPAQQGLHAQWNDKVQHALGFFIMALLAYQAHPRARSMVIILGLSLFGLALECVQAYLPHRQFSWLDWLADIAGVLSYVLLAFLMSWLTVRKRKFVPD